MGLFNLLKKPKIDISTRVVSNNNQELKFNPNIDSLIQVFNAYSFYGEEKHISKIR